MRAESDLQRAGQDRSKMNEVNMKKPWIKPEVRRLSKDEVLDLLSRNPTAEVPLKARLK
jgi:hypothetical protein